MRLSSLSLSLLAATSALLLTTGCGSDNSEGPSEADVDASLAVDANFPGLSVQTDLSRNHATRGESIDYPVADEHPPLGGNHAALWMNCGVYTAPVPTENAVHSLEHGAVWITYQPDLPAEAVQALTAAANSAEKVLLSPREQDQPVYLTAWGRQLAVTDPTDPVVTKFVEAYADGPQTPEPGVTCQSPADQPGTVPYVLVGGEAQVSASTETVPAAGPIE